MVNAKPLFFTLLSFADVYSVCVCVCDSVCDSVCVLVEARVGVSCLYCSPPDFLKRGLSQHLKVTYHQGCPSSHRGPPASTFSAPGLQIHTSCSVLRM